ncbi:MAG: ABC transporter ATP-binding protein [Candidatus Aminicenantes bacterium]|nr:MAG: ABC transporter ATP-binding protein [Candidatus Aminicenantes bacterium]
MLEIKNLSFSYGKTSVFKDFNLKISQGQVCLITGINGVGKSTLLRLMAGVLRPAQGEIVFGEKLGVDPQRKIGFISDILSLYESLTVTQAIDYHKSVYNIPSVDDTLIKHTKIGSRQKIKELSTGQRTILHLSLILSTEPELLLIDEIIHSIDAYLRRVFLEQLVQLLTKRHITVVMVNLNFHDIEHLVERVILLKSGEIAVDESIEALKAKVKKIVSDSPPDFLNILTQIDYSDHSEFFVYPFEEKSRGTLEGEVVDLNLTEIVTAFIGGEYA